jgi:hypothetical protein
LHSKRRKLEGPTQAPDAPESPPAEIERTKSEGRPGLVIAGLAALLLAGPAVASPVTADNPDLQSTVHDQFTNAFTPGPVALEPCCSVKMGGK